MKLLRRILSGAALVVMASGFASANSIIQTFSTGSNPVSYCIGPAGSTGPNSGNTCTTGALTIAAFDPSLGTLNDITFTISDASMLTDMVTASPSGAGTYTWTPGETVAVQDPSGNVTDWDVPTGVRQRQTLAANQTYTFTGTASTSGVVAEFDGSTGALVFYNGTSLADISNPIN